MDIFTYEGSILSIVDFSLIVSALIQRTCNMIGNRRLTLDKYNNQVAED